MGYRTTDHKKAIVKMVREKRIILQIDLASMMNKQNINDSVKSLVEEGKLKRQKVNNRGKVGNLTEVWAVYRNDVKQSEILDFEKLMINKPFTSPLVDNHCYKSPEQPIQQQLKDTPLKDENRPLENNVVDMQKYIKINKQDVKIKEYHGVRVVTIKDVATVHEKLIKAVNQQMERNKHRLVKDVDYFIIDRENLEVTGCDLGKLFNSNRQKEAYLLTEVGYMMLVKSFTDDLSWDVQRQLVNSYFKIQEIKTMQEDNFPVTKQSVDLTNTYDILRVFATGMTDLNDRVKSLESTIESLKTAITG